MTEQVRIALAQLNPIVGDVSGNAARLTAVYAQARAEGADLLVTPELYLAGYPAEDLLLHPTFIREIAVEVARLAVLTSGGTAMIVGVPWHEEGKLYNAALLLEAGRIAGISRKRDLPNYGVFDEKRVFAAGQGAQLFTWRGIKLGVPICEDIWTPGAVASLRAAGAELVLVPNCSPYQSGKMQQRQDVTTARARESGLPVVYVNLVGGQDELVFDGASFVVAADGTVMAHAAAWQEDVLFLDFQKRGTGWHCVTQTQTDYTDDASALYAAMMLGLRDYARKNGFTKALLGLSGGIDSALVAALAVDALGAENVWGVMLPSPFTSQASLDDAGDVAVRLGIRYDKIDLVPALKAFEAMMQPLFADHTADVTEENIQSRSRGVALMALSNKFGHLLLATGNKSELATGYATLYGDMCGGFAPLKDLYKTQVYEVAAWRNRAWPEGALGSEGVVIADTIMTKAPTAELRPNQRDSDTLPPYPQLDGILRGLIEDHAGVEGLIAQGHDRDMVQRVQIMLARAEYKRRQGAPGVKLGSALFVRERRYPVTAGFKG
ncbi:MAG: NAD+ synthase [Alphaproteobacteria bacterium]